MSSLTKSSYLLRKIIGVAIISATLPTVTLAESAEYGTCTVLFDVQMKLSLNANAAMASLDGFENVNEFMFGNLCDWRPQATFLVGGMIKDSDGMYSMRRSSEGLDEVDVTVDGCTFQMSFGKNGKKFVLNDNRRKCEKPVSSGASCEIEWINSTNESGDFTGSCGGRSFAGTYSGYNTTYTVTGPAGSTFGQNKSDTILRACGCN